MSAPVIKEFTDILQQLQESKAPGISGKRIARATEICFAHVQYESTLIQKLYTHFKKTPGSHKLGVLYVIDSVCRKFQDEAKSIQSNISATAEDGTVIAGLYRITDLLPSLMNDILRHSPPMHKEKIKKLIDIWERCGTFSTALLASLRAKTVQACSTTPPGSPPPHVLALYVQEHHKVAQDLNDSSFKVNQDEQKWSLGGAAAILEALSKMAKTSAPAEASLPAVAQGLTLNLQNALPPLINPGDFQSLGGVNSIGLNGPFGNYLPPASLVPSPQGLVNAATQQIVLLQMMRQQGVPLPQIAAAMQAMGYTVPPLVAVQNSQTVPNYQPAGVTQQQQRTEPPPRDTRHRHRDDVLSPAGGRQRGSRSRSPRALSPSQNRRRSPTYDNYDNYRETRGFDREAFSLSHGRTQSDSEQRDVRPLRYGNTHSPRLTPHEQGNHLSQYQPRWIDHDEKLAREGKIKVLSRTLFVGGVVQSQGTIREMFEQFGGVQTCIVNPNKRHAFVKMLDRAGALSALVGMEKLRPNGEFLRTRWGVGFGPRDCNDYLSGISIIGLDRLTSADRRWIVNAEYGGLGGRPLVAGVVVEEPDIEIGHGVSSKAMSKRHHEVTNPEKPRTSNPNFEKISNRHIPKAEEDFSAGYGGQQSTRLTGNFQWHTMLDEPLQQFN